MSEHQIDIADMQCWVFRMAQSKWGMTAADSSALFKKYGIFGFFQSATIFSISMDTLVSFTMLKPS